MKPARSRTRTARLIYIATAILVVALFWVRRRSRPDGRPVAWTETVASQRSARRKPRPDPSFTGAEA